ncbi:Uu.00g021160.m01.CDS01 [Anthostomella pinea]|uniref:Uu.00g021160.m01.CDS01 n=1 Tax=Anthostomella pinea TaxID=933095 RepID=A0AAI8YNQ9_9PEZI|nr:Uu.00g021160.m01.CDS01 [Anthostomella pinea]
MVSISKGHDGLRGALTSSLVLAGNLLFNALPVQGQAVLPARNETGVSAYLFDLSQVQLTDSRWLDNQDRTLAYLKAVDVERLLYNFRSNHNLSTNGASANGGWDDPTFPFRSHVQGHILTAWAQCWVTLQDTECRDRATYFVAELAKCQANDANAGFATGYLSGFPESDFTLLESGTLTNGNVPYYVIHKTLAGLLDVWRHIGDTNAKDVLLALAGWVNTRTGKLSTSNMQSLMQTEFGGMNDVLAEIYYWTGDSQWLTTAQRFDHAAVFDPLASDEDQLNGLHANTQVPKWIGAVHEYKQTGTTRYLDIAKNAWDITVNDHTYAIGGNSQAEHFHEADIIAGYLTNDTAEACNSYNMLKLTRELWTIDPDASYFDFYERALLNHLLGQQNPSSNHGHITYFTPLDAGGHRGIGPAWGGGTWSTDYESFWCCQGTGVETNTKLMDSIYAYDESSLYVNLFTPSKLNWIQRSTTVTQTTTYPVGDTTTLTVVGAGTWDMKIRIPSWTSGAAIAVNGEQRTTTTTPGSYLTLSRTWASGDTVTVALPMTLRLIAANDDQSLAAVAYGPTVLSGNYGNSSLSSAPTLTLSSLVRTSTSTLDFTGMANGENVSLGPFYDAQGFNYVVYWSVSGSLPS